MAICKICSKEFYRRNTIQSRCPICQAKVVKKINPRSKSRSSQEVQYSKDRMEYLTQNDRCTFEGCSMPSTDVHHKKGRIGDLLLDQGYWMAVCRSHHDYIELHPKEAIERGYSIPRHKK